MRQNSGKLKEPAEKVIKDIRRATRKRHSSEEKIRIVLEGLRGEMTRRRPLTHAIPTSQRALPHVRFKKISHRRL